MGDTMAHEDWRANAWTAIGNHAGADGALPNFCVHDHDDHVHLIFPCHCGNCGSKNYRIGCTLEMLCDTFPREIMHIHEQPKGKPADPDIVATLKTFEYQPASPPQDCSVCHEDLAQDDVVIELPCRHLFHQACLAPWLERANTCPSCRYELTAKNAKTTRKGEIVRIGEEGTEGAGEREGGAYAPEPSVLEDFFTAEEAFVEGPGDVEEVAEESEAIPEA